MPLEPPQGPHAAQARSPIAAQIGRRTHADTSSGPASVNPGRSSLETPIQLVWARPSTGRSAGSDEGSRSCGVASRRLEPEEWAREHAVQPFHPMRPGIPDPQTCFATLARKNATRSLSGAQTASPALSTALPVTTRGKCPSSHQDTRFPIPRHSPGAARRHYPRLPRHGA